MALVSGRRSGAPDTGSSFSGNEFFNKPEVTQRGGIRRRYEELLSQNELLATCDIVKEMLFRVYFYRQEKGMSDRRRGLPRNRERELRVVCAPRAEPHGRNRRPRQAPDLVRQSRGNEQHDQVSQEGRVRLPRRRVLLPQDLRFEQALLTRQGGGGEVEPTHRFLT